MDQQIAAKELELARLRARHRRLDTGRKVILGGMLMASAAEDPRIAAWIIREAEKRVTRATDRKRIEPYLDILRSPSTTTDAEAFPPPLSREMQQTMEHKLQEIEEQRAEIDRRELALRKLLEQ